MSHADEGPPPMHLGDYPHGAFWSAERREPNEEHVDHVTIDGDVIRFMWDYGVIIPLWADGELVPYDPAWLRAALGIDDSLIRALARWGSDMEALDANPSPRADPVDRELDRRARELVERLRLALAPRFTVEYKPW